MLPFLNTPHSSKELACLSNSLWEEPRWKVSLLIQLGCIYNQWGFLLHLPYDPSTIVVTIWHPMAFQFTWLFKFYTCPLDFHFIIHFWNTNYTIHHYGVVYDNSWHDMTTQFILTSWWCGNVSPLFFFLLCVSFRMMFFPPSHGLGVRSLQWCQVLSCGRKLVSFFFLLVS